MTILLKLIQTFFCNPYKTLSYLFCRNLETHPKIHREMQMTQNSQNSLEEKKVTEFELPDFKTYYKTLVIITLWNWPKVDVKTDGIQLRVRHKYQWSIIFDKGTKIIQWKESFQQMVARQSHIIHKSELKVGQTPKCKS